MENEKKPFGDKGSDEDELLDFEFDDLAKDSGGVEDEETAKYEEIIELVDVVEEGEVPPASNTEGIERILEKVQSGGDLQTDETESERSEDKAGEENPTASEVLDEIGDTELDLIDEEDTLAVSGGEEDAKEVEESQSLVSDFESAMESLKSSEESSGAEELIPLEDASIIEMEDSEMVSEDTEEQLEELAFESDMELPVEDLSAIPEQDEDQVESFASVEQDDIEAKMGISEEKMEAIIARAVGETVRESVATIIERVARETMTTVAEKLITEAIEALKESLDSKSE